MGKNNVIAMIGSLRYKIEHDAAVEQFFLNGYVPIPLIQIRETGGLSSDDVKKIADEHIRKVIDMSDIVYVVNVDGYMGPSTLGEIKYAVDSKKPVLCKEHPLMDAWQIHERTASELSVTDCAILRAPTQEHARDRYMRLHGYTNADDCKIEISEPASEIVDMLIHATAPCSNSVNCAIEAKKVIEQQSQIDFTKYLVSVKCSSQKDYIQAIKNSIPYAISRNSVEDLDSFNKLVTIQHILNM